MLVSISLNAKNEIDPSHLVCNWRLTIVYWKDGFLSTQIIPTKGHVRPGNQNATYENKVVFGFYHISEIP